MQDYLWIHSSSPLSYQPSCCIWGRLLDVAVATRADFACLPGTRLAAMTLLSLWPSSFYMGVGMMCFSGDGNQGSGPTARVVYPSWLGLDSGSTLLQSIANLLGWPVGPLVCSHRHL